ncbi:MAG: DUF3429 domain-containing protein [Henriciella sp.]|uniref:DUF3429 domain-containing protein n=1 Tax=Henriciella sp. TaxID=1968823 RepID=UPI0032EE6758
MSDVSPTFRHTAAGLTGAGALPFIALTIAMGVLDAPTNLTASFWLMVYATVILSFLGGIRWGLALTSPSGTPLRLVLSVLPALAGWVIVPYAILVQQIPSPEWFLAYAALFALQFGWDWTSTAVPGWFKPIRLMVSGVVIACLIAAWVIRAFAG